MYHRLKEVNVVPQEPLEVKKQGIPFKDCIYKWGSDELAFLYFAISGLGKRIQSSLLFGETKSSNFHTKFFKIPQVTQFQTFQLKQWHQPLWVHILFKARKIASKEFEGSVPEALNGWFWGVNGAMMEVWSVYTYGRIYI